MRDTVKRNKGQEVGEKTKTTELQRSEAEISFLKKLEIYARDTFRRVKMSSFERLRILSEYNLISAVILTADMTK